MSTVAWGCALGLALLALTWTHVRLGRERSSGEVVLRRTVLWCTISGRWRYVYRLRTFYDPPQQHGQAIPAERQQIPA